MVGAGFGLRSWRGVGVWGVGSSRARGWGCWGASLITESMPPVYPASCCLLFRYSVTSFPGSGFVVVCVGGGVGGRASRVQGGAGQGRGAKK